MKRKIVLLTAGHTNPRTAKTSTGLLRFCPDECVAVLDPDHAGKMASDLLEVGENVPIVASLADVEHADTFVLGIAPPGGKIPDSWIPIISEAIDRDMKIVSGLHDFLSEHPVIAKHANEKNVPIVDVRKNDFKQISRHPEFRSDCFRVHTVGHDCSVGKMLVSLTLARGLEKLGHRSKFIATGQTGIMVEGDGLPIDCVAADFVSGAAEHLVVSNEQDHDVLVVEGQGSLVHPAYSQVTLGLLHGCRPHALVFVFEAGRESVAGLDHVPLIGLREQISLFETMGSLYHPCKTIALAMNGRKVSPDRANEIAQKVSEELELPVTDVVRDGPDSLLATVNEYYQSEVWRTA